VRFLRGASKLSKLGSKIDDDWGRRTSGQDSTMRSVGLKRQLDGRVLPARPRAESVTGTARVLAVGPTQPVRDQDPLLTVELLVMLPGRRSRRVKTSLAVPTVYLDILTVGATVPIHVPADRPDEVSVNWAALGTRALVDYGRSAPAGD
jgi:hypothetical protein